jgi:Tol biopolymer transport system component
MRPCRWLPISSLLTSLALGACGGASDDGADTDSSAEDTVPRDTDTVDTEPDDTDTPTDDTPTGETDTADPETTTCPTVRCVTPVSTAADGTFSDGSVQEVSFSADGTKVVFASDATNLVPGDTNGNYDIFLKELATGAISRVSVASDGAQSNGASNAPRLSPDGTKVVFVSFAQNLAAGDTSSREDVFVKDLVTGETTRVSVNDVGAENNGSNSQPSFSPDGTKVLFVSNASNLDAVYPYDGRTNVFLKDLATGAVTRISVDASGAYGNGGSSAQRESPPQFSSDGTRVLFVSSASNFVAGDTNGRADAFLKDLTTGAITRVSVDATGTEANNVIYEARLSPDGTKVVFMSTATNLVANDTNGQPDIFVKDLATGAVTLASVAADGTQTDQASSQPRFSPDGTQVVFSSNASNLVPGDLNGSPDIFIKDLTTGVVTRVSLTTDGRDLPGSSYEPHFSPDGGAVLSVTDSAALAAGDTNGTWDAFVLQGAW